MAGAERTQLFDLLNHLLQQVEAESNEEEVELRAKIEALGREVTKVPSKQSAQLDDLQIAQQLDDLSTKLDHVDALISSAMVTNPEVQSLLQCTSDLWMPVIGYFRRKMCTGRLKQPKYREEEYRLRLRFFLFICSISCFWFCGVLLEGSFCVRLVILLDT